MAEPEVFFVHLRRPRSASADPSERRDDPFYEFGSFGCTKCHATNLFHPRRHAEELEGARLAFVQGGPRGFRLVFLTPPITVRRWTDCYEARWTPVAMPFKYTEAPMLASNHGSGNFPMVEQFARGTKRTTVEGGLSSRLRSRARLLPVELAKEVVAVYEQLRAAAPPSHFASTYEQALPYAPPRIDRNREATYRRHISELAGDPDGAGSVLQAEVLPEVQTQSRCGLSRRRQSKPNKSMVPTRRTRGAC